MKAEKHDWKDDSAVLVNITASHAKYSVRRFRRRKCWKRKLNLLIVTWSSVVGNMRILKKIRNMMSFALFFYIFNFSVNAAIIFLLTFAFIINLCKKP